MAETISLMDVDEADNDTIPKPTMKSNKGKNVVVSGDGKSTLWVEKYRPQSLADVAAHRDIIDTSNFPFFHQLSFCRYLGFPNCNSTTNLVCLQLIG